MIRLEKLWLRADALGLEATQYSVLRHMVRFAVRGIVETNADDICGCLGIVPQTYYSAMRELRRRRWLTPGVRSRGCTPYDVNITALLDAAVAHKAITGQQALEIREAFLRPVPVVCRAPKELPRGR